VTFSPGVFYSIQRCAVLEARGRIFNTFFYMIDGFFRRRFFGLLSDEPRLASMAIVGAAALGLSLAAIGLARGWKLRQ